MIGDVLATLFVAFAFIACVAWAVTAHAMPVTATVDPIGQKPARWVEHDLQFYSAHPVLPGAVREVCVRCPTTFYGSRLAIASKGFAICNVQVNRRSVWEPLPADRKLGRESFPLYLTAFEDDTVLITVRNDASDPSHFSAAISGRGAVG